MQYDIRNNKWSDKDFSLKRETGSFEIQEISLANWGFRKNNINWMLPSLLLV